MLRNYFIMTLKVLARRKFFTFVSLFGVSFTLMMLMVASAFLDYSFTSMGAERKFDRVVTGNMFRMRSPDRGSNWQSNASYYTISHYIAPIKLQMPDVVEEFSIFKDAEEVSAFKDGQKIPFSVRYTDDAYFRVVSLSFVEGGPFTRDDFEQGRLAMVINESIRQKFFGGQTALGKDFLFDGQRFKIVGVVENVPEMRTVATSDVWAPISAEKATKYREIPATNEGLMGSYRFAFLAKQAKLLPVIQSAVPSSLKNVAFPDPKEYNLVETVARTQFQHIAAQIFFDWETYYSTDQSPKLVAALAITAFIFMLLPSLNLINLNLSRMLERSSEVGVRRAFGASILSLIGQFIVENIVLSLIGGAIGFVLSTIALAMLNQSEIFAHSDFSLNIRVFAVGLGLTVIFGLFSGVYPAWRMARLHPVKALKGSTK